MIQTPPPSLSRLKRINFWLSMVVVVLALYVIAYPFWPALTYTWNDKTNHRPPLVVANESRPASDRSITVPEESIPVDNVLVIPRINLQEVIYDGLGVGVLEKGLWHRPASSNPGEGGNTVIAGHRFTYRGAAVFYHLDKVEVGDKVIVYWGGKKYQYEVVRSYVVTPSDPTVEAATDTPRLTLYTCTPLWTSKNRLVIQAEFRGET